MSGQDNFQQLLAELELAAEETQTMAKALPAESGKKDDKAIVAAAEEGNPEDDDDDDEGHEEPDGDEGKPMAKSLTIDDEEYQVVDADQLIKSLHDLTGRVETNEGVLAKAMESMLGTIKSQSDMIKSLNARVEKLAGEGRGRKTVLTVHEKPPAGEQLAKSQPDGMTPAQALAKCHEAFTAGKITGLELTCIDAGIRLGQVDQSILAKALA